MAARAASDAAIASSHCSLVGCEECAPDGSAKVAPLPFTVFRIRQVGLPLHAFACSSAAQDLLHVVAVGYVDNVPAECVKLGADALAVAHNIGNRTIQLTAVVIHETYEVIQLVVRGKLSAFPDLALIALAVAYGNVNTARTIPARGCRARRRWLRSCPDRASRSSGQRRWSCCGRYATGNSVFGWLSVYALSIG